MYPTTSPSTSVTARSVRGITSPSIEKPVRPSRRATLNEGQPMYASLPIRRARFSPTRCQYWIVPSTPAFSLMSWMSDTRATSSMFVFLLRSINRVSPLDRRGDEIAKFEAREDLLENYLVDAERALQRRQALRFGGEGGEHASLRRGSIGRPRRTGRRPLRGLREALLDRRQPHTEGLHGLVRGEPRQR